MRRRTLGCLCVGFVVLLGVSITAYYFAVRPVANWAESLGKFGEYTAVNAGIQNTGSFTPPTENLLTKTQVDRFVRVQRTIVRRMGEHLVDLRTRYETLARDIDTGDRSLAVNDLRQFWIDFSGTLIRVKQIQVEALNSEGFSLEEYAWIRSEFYRAIGANFFAVNLERLAEALEKRNLDVLSEGPSSKSLAPGPNRRLVSAYQNEFRQWLAYAWLGL